MTKSMSTCFLVRSRRNPLLILTVSGEFVPESLCGPGMHCAKIYKTQRGAERVGTDDSRTVHPCNAYGVEIKQGQWQIGACNWLSSFVRRELLAEVLRESNIGPGSEARVVMDDGLAKLRAMMGMRPKRRRAKNPKPTVQDRLIVLLEEKGVSDLDVWKVSRGYWLRDQQDVMRWECQAYRWGDLVAGERARHQGFHVGSWSSMSDCVRYGITVVDGEKHGGGYCTISVEANYSQKKKGNP